MEDRYQVESLCRDKRGGQQVTWSMPSGVKVTDLITGNIAICKTSRSQHKNRTKAIEALQWME